MEKNTSQPQEINGNIINIPHVHSSDEARAVEYGNMIDGYTGETPTIHSIAQIYDNNQKFKQIFNDTIFK